MVFRDDMEALRARNESLEVDLELLRGVARERDELEARVEEQEKELAHLKEQIEPLEEKRSRKRRWMILSGVMIVLIFVGIFTSLMNSLSAEKEHSRALQLAEIERTDIATEQRSVLEGQLHAVRRELESARTENIFLDRELREAQEQPPFDLVVLPGRVRRATGQAPTTVGTSCTIEVRPDPGEHNCRVIVTCGETLLYGTEGQGYNICGLRDERPTFARENNVTDEDGDPMFELDLVRRHVMISDGPTPDSPEYTLLIAVEER